MINLKQKLLIPLAALTLALPNASKAQEQTEGILTPDNIVESTISSYNKLSKSLKDTECASTAYGQLGLTLDYLSLFYPENSKTLFNLKKDLRKFRIKYGDEITRTLNLKENLFQKDLRIKDLSERINQYLLELRITNARLHLEQANNYFLRQELEQTIDSTGLGVEAWTDGIELNKQIGDLIFGLGVYRPNKDETQNTTTQHARNDLANGHYTLIDLINTTTARNHDYAVAARFGYIAGSLNFSLYPSLRERETIEQQETRLSHYVHTDEGDIQLSTRSERSNPTISRNKKFDLGYGVGFKLGKNTRFDVRKIGKNVSAGLNYRFGGKR